MQRLLFDVVQSVHRLIDHTLVRAFGSGSSIRLGYLARADELKTRLSQDPMETASRIPDWVLEEMTALGREIDPALNPTDSFLKECQYYEFPVRPAAGLVYEQALQQCRFAYYTHCFAIPWLQRGGADLVTLFHIQTVARRPGARVLVIMTEPGDSPWISRIPSGVDVMSLAGPLSTLTYPDGLLVLARVLVQLRIDVLHIINSRHIWDVIGRYGLAIRQNSRIFGSIYCDDYDRSGVPTGFARDYLGACYKHLTKLFSDNTAFPRLLLNTYGYSPDLFQVLKSPAAFNMPDEPVRAPRGRRVLWAGRLDRQKRPDILLAVASAMPDVEFVVYGQVLLDSDKHLVQQLAGLQNLRMTGPFDGVEALPFAEFSVYLYTSQWDGTPTIVIAAALASIPIVASCVGGVGDIITEHTGFPVKNVEDIAAYVRGIEEALRDPTDAETRAMAARRLIQNEYTLARFEAGLAGCEGYMDHIARDAH
jgi:glycosyltransferase involved in cell wall biosynthesis